jgi:hypothetical protein
MKTKIAIILSAIALVASLTSLTIVILPRVANTKTKVEIMPISGNFQHRYDAAPHGVLEAGYAACYTSYDVRVLARARFLYCMA